MSAEAEWPAREDVEAEIAVLVLEALWNVRRPAGFTAPDLLRALRQSDDSLAERALACARKVLALRGM